MIRDDEIEWDDSDITWDSPSPEPLTTQPKPPVSALPIPKSIEQERKKGLLQSLFAKSDKPDPVAEDVGNILTGAVKGLGQLGVGAGKLAGAGKYNPLSMAGEALAEKLYPDVNIPEDTRSLPQQIRGTQNALWMEPEGTAQHIGSFAGKMLPALATGGGSLVAQMAGNAALSGGQTALEGGGAGDVALASAFGAGGPLAGKAAGKLAPWLKGKAVEQYTKALHPTGRTAKIETAKIVPQLLRRGVKGDLEQLAAKGEELSDLAGEGIEAAYSASSKAGKRIDAKKLADDLEALKVPFMAESAGGRGLTQSEVQSKLRSGMWPSPEEIAGSPSGGKVILNENAVSAISDIQDQLRAIKPDPDNLWKLRKNLDNIVQASNGFLRPLPPQTSAAIAKDARAVIQKELTKAHPDIAKLNGEYQLWESLQRVATETAIRKTGQQGAAGMLARGAGGIVGAAVGSAGGAMGTAGGAMAGQQVTKKLTELVSSPRWRTVSAVHKARLAALLSSGRGQEAINYMGKLSGVTAGQVSMGIREGVEQQRRQRELSNRFQE